jgi:dTDP-4-amino-4,6-dideoxygalactose transaminase
MAHLSERGIQSGIHYPIPIHLQAAYSELGYKRDSFPLTEQLADEVLSLPMYPELNREQVDAVANSVKEFLQRAY